MPSSKIDYKDLDKYAEYMNRNKKKNYAKGNVDCKQHNWTVEEVNLIMESKLTDRELSKIINHSVQAIQIQRSRVRNKLEKTLDKI